MEIGVKNVSVERSAVVGMYMNVVWTKLSVRTNSYLTKNTVRFLQLREMATAEASKTNGETGILDCVNNWPLIATRK